MEPTITEFLKIFSEFNSVNSVRLEFFFDTALGRITSEIFHENQSYKMAVYLMTAHTASMLDPSKAANGSIASEKVGDVAVSYNTSNVGNPDSWEDLPSTQYGLQLMRLLKENIISAQVL